VRSGAAFSRGAKAKTKAGRGRRLGRRRLSQEKDALDDVHWERKVARDGRCSAYVRVTDGNGDLLVGHATWNDYSSMTRVFKFYDLPLGGEALSGTMTRVIAMSSYPGLISSGDDYYVMDSGLVVADTSLEILNPALYDKVQDFPLQPHVPAFMHLMAVNRLAKTGADWAQLLQTVNAGTANAQWMVVDYNAFNAFDSTIKDNTLWVVEQVPGLSE
jgi:hypothetical protein